MMPEYISVALQTLRVNPLRTLLSTLGVIIGVGSLVSILSLADGLEAFSRQEIAATTDLQMITVAPVTTDRADGVTLRRRDYPVFTPADEAELQRLLGTTAQVALSSSYAGFWNVEGDTAVMQAVIAAVTPGVLVQRNAPLIAGRVITDDDVASSAPVALLSVAATRALGPEPAAAVGRAIRIGDRSYSVIGVLDPNGEESVARLAIPLVPPADLPGAAEARPPALAIRAARVEEAPAVRAQTEAWLAQRWDTAGRTFAVSSNVDRVAQASRGMLIFKLVMGTIAGISLVVGGIGIMNVLLASVTERTREIGIRRASGARRRDIRRQFLAEAVAISAVGSGLGAVLGMTVSVAALRVISNLAEARVSAVFAWESIVFAIGAALFVGLVFGMYPALRAARLSPIEALRHE
jgi:putative ABC transport system permease protein